jgi:DNA-3-methyladenine glycosylase I
MTVSKSARNDVRSRSRCGWVGERPHFIRYHDEEWGVPVHDDRKHFEMLLLEGAQAGLTWETILLRREGYRRAFAAFDPAKVARFDATKKAALLQDAGIIRNRLKVEAAVTNAQAFLAIQRECGSFNAYVWAFVGGQPIVNRWKTMSEVPATTAASDALSKDLKKRGFKFVGSTIIYAYMQAIGLVNDHVQTCFRRNELERPIARLAGNIDGRITKERPDNRRSHVIGGRILRAHRTLQGRTARHAG